ncbi:hydrophobin-251 [Melanogaster broomeanus]|nr:hydrophobin-251 [Melanogaster broomeanus]
MFARLFAVASLAALAVAQPERLAARGGDCNTGDIQCCSTVQSANSLTSMFAAAGLASVLAGVTTPVGLNCVSVIGSNTCQQQPVCCDENNYNGLVNIGCSPVNVNA